MRPFGGLVRSFAVLTRLRVATVFTVVGMASIGAMALSPPALGSRVITKPTHSEILTGHDWPGRVQLQYTEMDRAHGPGSVFFISGFKFANMCSRRGSELPSSVDIPVGKHTLFHYQGYGFTIEGNVIGGRAYPRKLVGLASISLPGCQSGPWWWSVGH